MASSLSAAVNSGKDPWAGGTYAPNAPPTAVGGTFTPVGAPGFPNAAAGQIVSARNNRGTNVRIPYAVSRLYKTAPFLPYC